MSRHQFDLLVCMNQPGTNIGLVCEKCDGRCPICDSFVNPANLVHICDTCAYGKGATSCIMCGSRGTSEAHYCQECCLLERDRDGCPKILNVGSNQTSRDINKTN